MKSYEEKILAMVIKPEKKKEKKIEALGRHLKLRALGFFMITFNWFNYIVFISAVHKHISYFHIILYLVFNLIATVQHNRFKQLTSSN